MKPLPVAFACLLALCVRASAADAPATQPAASQLIGQLGDDNFKTREAASAALLKLGKAALPELKEAATSPDPETSARAQALVKRIEHPLIAGEADRPNGPRTARSLNTSITNGVRVVNVVEETRKIRISVGPEGIELVVSSIPTPGEEAVTETYKAKDADQLKADNPDAFAVVQRWGGMNNGAMTINGGMIRINGNVVIGGGAVAGGFDNIDAPAWRRESDALNQWVTNATKDMDPKAATPIRSQASKLRILISQTRMGGNDTIAKALEGADTFRDAAKAAGLEDPGDALPPSAFFRFGARVELKDKALVVREVAAKSMAATLGLKVGDIVTHVADKRVTTPDEWRRAAVLAEPPVSLSIQRDGKPLVLKEEVRAPASRPSPAN